MATTSFYLPLSLVLTFLIAAYPVCLCSIIKIYKLSIHCFKTSGKKTNREGPTKFSAGP